MVRSARRAALGGSTVGPAPGLPTARIRGAMLLVMALLALLAFRLVYVQGIDPAGHATEAMDQRLKTWEIEPERGSILDRDGGVLAASVRRYDLVVDQRLVKDFREWNRDTRTTDLVDVDSRLTSLAEVLGRPEDEVRKAAVGDAPYAVIARSVDPQTRDRAMALRVPGLLSEAVDRRTYPNGAVAGSLVGFMAEDGRPLEGFEKSQDAALTGTPGERRFEVGADGIRIPTGTDEVTPAVDGADVRLTLDTDAQWFAQETMASLADELDAEWASAVVMDARTGDLLAVADSTTVDPADPGATDGRFRTSITVSTPYEPGSTGKAPTLAATIDATDVSMESTYDVPDHLSFDNQPPIRDFAPHATSRMTVAGIFARSYNTGTVKVAEEISDEQRYEYMRSFGLGQPMDLGLPWTAQSELTAPQDWDGRQRLTTTFGQGYTVTTLHTAQMYQAMANGGVLEPARLIDAIVDEDGTEHRWEPERREHRVITEDTSEQMLRGMETVVTRGTSKAAAIPGYRVGGKSSTAEVAGKSGTYDGYNLGFTSVAPLDHPRFVVSVSVNRPDSGRGSRAVATSSARIMEHMLRQADIPAAGDKPHDYNVFAEDPQDRPW